MFFFITISFCVRMVTFFHSSYDWDESLYIVGALELTKGNLPYLTVWDHKPPGIFFLFALILNFTDSIVFPIRILSCISVGLSGYVICRLVSGKNYKHILIGIVAALLYILSSLKNGGVAANSEIFYVTFILFSFLLATTFINNNLHRKIKSDWHLLFFSSLLLGVAGSINYLALLYCGALGLYILIPLFRNTTFDNKETKYVAGLQLIKALVIGLSGPLIVTLSIVILYLVNGSFDELYYANITANAEYISSKNQPFDLFLFLKAMGNQVSANWLLWICLFISLFLNKEYKALDNRIKQVLLLSVCWLGASFLAIFVSRLYWPHYFLQFNPALCIIAAVVICKILESNIKKNILLPLAGIFLILLGGDYSNIRDTAKEVVEILKHRVIAKEKTYGDLNAQISEYINNRIEKDDYIYVLDYNPIIYSLSQSKIPTKYIFPPFLIGRTSARMVDGSSINEVNNILKLKPVYIVRKRERPEPEGTIDEIYRDVDSVLKKEYSLEKSFKRLSSNEYIDLYKLSILQTKSVLKAVTN